MEGQNGQSGTPKDCIGIVILNYRNWDDTRQCIESIHKNPPRVEYVVFLVDNASDNVPGFALQPFIEEYQVVFIQNQQNNGYNAGNNVGIAKALEAGCSHILISNSDVRYLKGSIQKMKDYLDEHPQVGIVGPKVLDRNGRVQKSHICRRTGMKEKYMVRTRANVIFKKSMRSYFGMDRDYTKPFEVYAVLGCCFLLSRGCAMAVTPFDVYPFLYEEEFMLGIRMEQLGYRTVCEPQAAVRHLCGGSTRYRQAFAFAHNVRSELYYCRQYLHAGKWQVYPLYCYRVLSYLARCFGNKDFRQKWKWFLKMTREEWGRYE